MPANNVAENVLGTLGMTVFIQFHVTSFTSAFRDGVLDDPAHPADLEELAREIHRGAFGPHGVSLFAPISFRAFSLDLYSLMWSVSAWFLGVYAIVQDLNIPIIVQQQIFSFLTLASWAQVGSTTFEQ